MIWAFVAAVLVLDAIIFAPFLREALRKPMDKAARANAPGQFATLSRGVTHYRWFGPDTGPVAVCVHGLTTPSFVWEGLVDDLVQMGFRVLTYDHYGRGYSDRPKGLQDRAFFVDHLNELLEDQRVTDGFTLIGYSMGGAIATAFGAAHPDRLRRVVLIAPAGMGHNLGRLARMIRRPGIGDWLMLAKYPHDHRKGCEAERGLPSSVPGIVDLQLNEQRYRGWLPAVLSSLRGILSDVFEADHRALANAGLPVLAIWGRDDSVIPIAAKARMSDWNPAASHVVVDGAGHGLTYTHTPQVAGAIRDLVGGNP